MRSSTPTAPVTPDRLEDLARSIRRRCLTATTAAGSGHPTSSLSATDLMTGLIFGGFFRYHINDPQYPNNDRLIFSKGHASPLFYALWAAMGAIPDSELSTYRQFGSRLQGHPTPDFPHAEAATGSLGQGLGIGVGLALNARHFDELPYRTFVLLGDSEIAEGSVWEAIQLAAHYRLGNLTGILDVNRLGQRGETMLQHDVAAHAQRIESFGWKTLVIDGHDFAAILNAFQVAGESTDQPVMIIARTIKGKGVSFLEGSDNWHGKALNEEQLQQALEELGKSAFDAPVAPVPPLDRQPATRPAESPPAQRERAKSEATRKAYGHALTRLAAGNPEIVCLDAEVSNSTGAAEFKERHPGRFFEMFIAEQNMAGVALGFSVRGRIPFVSTFAAFFTRCFDQIRMAQYSSANIKFVGSHAGVSIGEDGPSQMGLEDIAMFRSILHSTVLHPCDAVSTEALVEAAAEHQGIVYLRTLRQATPVIYDQAEKFPLGGSKVLRRSEDDDFTIVAAGATVHEALEAHRRLRERGIHVRVIDAYSIKPIDATTLRAAALETNAIITVEDHYPAGGLGEAVLSALASVRHPPISMLAVRATPMSGTAAELQDFAGISAAGIIREIEHLNIIPLAAFPP